MRKLTTPQIKLLIQVAMDEGMETDTMRRTGFQVRTALVLVDLGFLTRDTQAGPGVHEWEVTHLGMAILDAAFEPHHFGVTPKYAKLVAQVVEHIWDGTPVENRTYSTLRVVDIAEAEEMAHTEDEVREGISDLGGDEVGILVVSDDLNNVGRHFDMLGSTGRPWKVMSGATIAGMWDPAREYLCKHTRTGEWRLVGLSVMGNLY